MVDVKNFTLGLAYFLIYTTPIGAGFLLWIFWVVFSTDYTLLSLSTHVFLQEKLNFLHVWVYSWFWNALLDFFWSFPAAILTSFKLVINTLLGFWLLRVGRSMH